MSLTAAHPLAALGPRVMLRPVAKHRVSGSVVCGIGVPDGPPPVTAYAEALARLLGAPLTAALGADGTAALTRLADAERARLLVVGVAGRMGPAATLGPVTRELVLRASCPVLVIPRGAPLPTEGWTRRPVLCIFDGSDAARPALNVAADTARRLRTVAFVAHVGAGSLRDVEARARSERPAVIVTASCGTEAWHVARPGAAPVRLATSGSTPVLFVPPAYRAAAARPLGISSPIGQPLDLATPTNASVASWPASAG